MANKTQGENYTPGNLPDTADGLIQFLYDELWRIAIALERFPAGFSVNELNTTIPVTTVPTEFRLFEGETPAYDLPGGGWDSTLGEWTASATGLYQVNCNAIIQPFGAGNKDYAADLKIYINDVEAFANSTVGDDAFSLSCAIAVSGLITREDVLRATLTLVHEQFTGNTTFDAYMSATSTALQ